MDIEHLCGMLNCNHNMDFSCCDHREYLGCDYKTVAGDPDMAYQMAYEYLSDPDRK